MSEPDTWTWTVSCAPTEAKRVSAAAGHPVVAVSVRQTTPVAACALGMTDGSIGRMEMSSSGIMNSSFVFFKLVYTDFLLEVLPGYSI